MQTLAGRHSGLRARWAGDDQLQAAVRARLVALRDVEEHQESWEGARNLMSLFGWPEQAAEEEDAQR